MLKVTQTPPDEIHTGQRGAEMRERLVGALQIVCRDKRLPRSVRVRAGEHLKARKALKT